MRVAIIILTGLMVFFTGCSEPLFLAQPGSDDSGQATNIKGLTIDVTEQGDLQYRIKAQQAWLKEQENQVHAQNIKINFFSSDERIAQLVADEGTFFLARDREKQVRKNDLLLEGNVLYKTADNVEVKTEALHWIDKEQVLVSDRPFIKRYTMNDSIVEISGQGFKTDKTLTNWIDEGATIKIYSQGEKEIEKSSAVK